MDIQLICKGKATLEDLCELYHKKGYEFVIEDGEITRIIY